MNNDENYGYLILNNISFNFINFLIPFSLNSFSSFLIFNSGNNSIKSCLFTPSSSSSEENSLLYSYSFITILSSSTVVTLTDVLIENINFDKCWLLKTEISIEISNCTFISVNSKCDGGVINCILGSEKYMKIESSKFESC
jgi:hypothetical protein